LLSACKDDDASATDTNNSLTTQADEVVRVVRLTGGKNFTVAWQEFMFNALVNLKPMQRSGIDIT